MNYKLKHLSKFCCKPTEAELQYIKEVAELEGFKFDHDYKLGMGVFMSFNKDNKLDSASSTYRYYNKWEEIPVIDFINKLRMTEEVAEKLEDDRVSFKKGATHWKFTDGQKSIKALNGHHFKTNEDGTEVTLHKRD